MLPARLTVKVNGVVPALPSVFTASSAAMEKLVSSLRMTPVAAAVPSVALPDGPANVTVNASSVSTAASPATLMVITALACPAAKLTVPDGNTPPAKSAAFAGFAPLPVTDQFTVPAAAVLPVRVTVKVKAADPASPSAFVASVAAMEITGGGASSFRIVPTAVAVPSTPPFEGPERVTVNVSSGSTVVSSAAFTVMTRLACPAAKLAVPLGSTPPVKSAGFAGLAPDPVTAQFTVPAAVISPVRVIVKVRALTASAATAASGVTE